MSRGNIRNRLEVIYYEYIEVTASDGKCFLLETEEEYNYMYEQLKECTEGLSFSMQKIVVTEQKETLSLQLIESQISYYKENYKILPKTCYPVGNSHKINSRYGVRNGGFHTGIDLFARYGDNVYSYKDGYVEYVNYSNESYGNQIIINHGDGIRTRYAHLSKINVSLGEHVCCGDTIGLAGTSGNSTGVHLHFEIIKNENTIDPHSYIF